MPDVLIRSLSAEAHEVLAARAAAQGQSLQRYLLGELERIAGTPTAAEVVARIEEQSGGRVGLGQAVEDLDGGRG